MWLIERFIRHLGRWFIALALLLIIFGISQHYWIKSYGGNYTQQPEEIGLLSKKAQQFVQKTQNALRRPIVDYRIPVWAFTTSDDQYVNPHYLSWKRPGKRFAFLTLASAAGLQGNSINELSSAEIANQVESRLVRQLRSQNKFSLGVITALDYYHDDAGKPDVSKSSYRTSNSYVSALSKRWPDVLQAAVSIHPHRLDALERLDYWAKQGVKYLHLIPAIQGIDPADERLEPFWRRAKRRGFTILTGSGHADTFYIHTNNEWGNPWRWEPALKLGLTVVLENVGGVGRYSNPYGDGDEREAHEIFMEMTEKEYGRRVLADIGRVGSAAAIPDLVQASLQRPELANHLVYASHYPMSATQRLLSLDELEDQLFITAEQQQWLREVYDYNPILSDWLLKATLRLPQTQGEDAIGYDMNIFSQKHRLP